MLMLEKITGITAFDEDRQNTADSMRNLLSTKQFKASSYLFWEIFVITGTILQGVIGVVACTCNPATLEVEFQKKVGSIPTGVTVL